MNERMDYNLRKSVSSAFQEENRTFVILHVGPHDLESIVAAYYVRTYVCTYVSMYVRMYVRT